MGNLANAFQMGGRPMPQANGGPTREPNPFFDGPRDAAPPVRQPPQIQGGGNMYPDPGPNAGPVNPGPIQWGGPGQQGGGPVPTPPTPMPTPAPYPGGGDGGTPVDPGYGGGGGISVPGPGTIGWGGPLPDPGTGGFGSPWGPGGGPNTGPVPGPPGRRPTPPPMPPVRNAPPRTFGGPPMGDPGGMGVKQSAPPPPPTKQPPRQPPIGGDTMTARGARRRY